MKPNREQVISKLKELLPELKALYGMHEVGIFGSMARGDYDEQSDVDIIASFSRPIGWEIVSLEEMLKHKLQRNSQVFHRAALKHSPLANKVLQDLIVL